VRQPAIQALSLHPHPRFYVEGRATGRLSPHTHAHTPRTHLKTHRDGGRVPYGTYGLAETSAQLVTWAAHVRMSVHAQTPSARRRLRGTMARLGLVQTRGEAGDGASYLQWYSPIEPSLSLRWRSSGPCTTRSPPPCRVFEPSRFDRERPTKSGVCGSTIWTNGQV